MSRRSVLFLIPVFLFCCSQQNENTDVTAAEILGNPEYPAFSYGGYRKNTRDEVPSVDALKEDMRILDAMGIKLLRTYNTQQYAHAANLLEAIRQMKLEDADFEMYVMLGAWIECQGAFSSEANHSKGNVTNNSAEIDAAVKLAQQYPDIVKIIAVGNEAMVQWAVSYFVYPNVILKWVNYLQDLKKSGELPNDLWVTSSDNYESWGGGAKVYQTDDLATLMEAVDFISLHTYPFHDSYYNPGFWLVPDDQSNLSDLEKIDAAMLRARDYAKSQYQGAVDYMTSLGLSKQVHIGETGWATISNSSYGATGSHAADEYKEKLYYQYMREWSESAGLSCFYFEAFDEQWKDEANPLGSENHFGLIKLNGQAKFALWDLVDQGTFEGLTRNGVAISKTYGGDEAALKAEILAPPLASEVGSLAITTVNNERESGEEVTEPTLVVVHESFDPNENKAMSYPAATLKLNAWEGTCGMEMSREKVVEIATGSGDWWGCAMEASGGIGENLSRFKSGKLNFEIKGNTGAVFNLGFQTGTFAAGTQTNNSVTFGPAEKYQVTEDYKRFSLPLKTLDQGANLEDVTALLFIRGVRNLDGKGIQLKNIYYTQN